MAIVSKITPCLWFDDQAEEAAKHYVSIFEDAGIDQITHYGKPGKENPGRPEGSVMTVAFHIAGQSFTALNGGPLFTFSEAISFQISCDTQAEIDRYWERLTQGGKESRCGWLKDKFGVSWQVVSSAVIQMLSDPDRRRVERVVQAFMPMSKLDIASIERAYRAD